MRKNTKIIILVSLAFIIVGGVLGVTSYFAANGKVGIYWDNGWQNKYSTENEYQDDIKVDTFTAINLQIDTATVTLKQGDEYRVEYHMFGKNREPKVEVANGVLTVTNGYSGRGIFLNFDFPNFLNGGNGIYPEGYMTIYYPATAKIDTTQLDVSSGILTVENLSAEALKIEQSSGRVVLTNVSAKKLDTSLTSGRMELQGVKAEDVFIDTSSSSIVIANSHFEKSGKIESTSGWVGISDTTIENLTIDQISGEISSSNSVFSNTKITTSSGNIDLQGALKGNSQFEMTSGSLAIKTSMPRNQYSLTVDVISGWVSVDGKGAANSFQESNSEENTIDVEGVSGTIDIDFGK